MAPEVVRSADSRSFSIPSGVTVAAPRQPYQTGFVHGDSAFSTNSRSAFIQRIRRSALCRIPIATAATAIDISIPRCGAVVCLSVVVLVMIPSFSRVHAPARKSYDCIGRHRVENPAAIAYGIRSFDDSAVNEARQEVTGLLDKVIRPKAHDKRTLTDRKIQEPQGVGCL
jgi:hypothetical protein